jgi:hypothetical protein
MRRARSQGRHWQFPKPSFKYLTHYTLIFLTPFCRRRRVLSFLSALRGRRAQRPFGEQELSCIAVAAAFLCDEPIRGPGLPRILEQWNCWSGAAAK